MLQIWNQDVFLSFSEDTRQNFTYHLYNALIGRGINTFRCDEKPRTDEISSELVKAINESRVSIVVFSRNYASSRCCLDELVKILECRSRIGQTLLPVFYDVLPSDIRNQTGICGEAFVKHEELFKENIEKVVTWRKALNKTANLSGWHLQNIADGIDKLEQTFIHKIVKEVLTKVDRSPLHIAKYPVGIDFRVTYLKGMLNLSSSDVRIVGICGMGGLGKTTIAKAAYNQIHHRFEGHSFLANAGEVSRKPRGLIQLQEQLLSDILMKDNLKISNVARGINLIKQRLSNRRVLVVLDDIDQPEQLIQLGINRDCLGFGSRIIITSRSYQLLQGVEVDEIYELHELNQYESLELFSWHAFKRESPINEYMELSKDVVENLGGLPLAIEVLGSLMVDKRSIPEWVITLEGLKSTPHNLIEEKLKLSFDALDDDEKETFLDIACFFVGVDKDYVIKILDGCGFFANIGISVLNRRSLIGIDENNELKMHNLLQDMGRKIVLEEAPEVPGRRSRLWFHEDVCEVLEKHEGSNSVEGLILNISQFEDISVHTKAFANMNRLRLLQLNNVKLRGSGYEHLSKELIWLCWHGFPLESIPTNFDLHNLVVLDMQNSRITEFRNEAKMFRRLKVIDLSHSTYLTKSPNFVGLDSLEILNFEGCTRLVEVHKSVGDLDKLVVLNLKNCYNLKNLPASISKLVSLERLNLSGCSVLSKSWSSCFHSWGSLRKRPLLPSFAGLSSLTTLNLSDCNLSEDQLPNDFGSLCSLTNLHLRGNSFCTLPTSISHLSSLWCLDLTECRSLMLLPQLPQLIILLLSECKKLQTLPELPASLMWLRTSGCSSLQEMPNLRKLSSLQGAKLNYEHFCNQPEDISFHPQLRWLHLCGCTKPLSMPKLPPKVLSLEIDGCTSMVLKEVSVHSQHISGIHIGECHHPENIFRKNSPFQGLYKWFEVFGPGNEIPEWMVHQSTGNTICFEVSPHLGCKFHGLDASAVFVVEEEEDDNSVEAVAIISNRTKGTKWIWFSGDKYSQSSSYEDQMWVCHIPFKELYVYLGGEGEFEAQSGDQLEFSINFEIEDFEEARVQVKKCGLLQVHMPDEETGLNENYSMIQHTSDDIVVNEERSLAVYKGDKNNRDHDDDEEESTSGSHVKRLKMKQ